MQHRPMFIAHRVNTAAQMAALPQGLGAEFDVRSTLRPAGQVHLHAAHDPAPEGAPIGQLLDAAAARGSESLLIANTKEDGLEADVAAAMAARGIGNYIFLDTQIPTLRRACIHGQGAHFAVRLSDCESVAYFARQPAALRPAWAWVDCFDGRPLPLAEVAPLGRLFSLCLVSPELHFKKDAADIAAGLQRIPQFMDLARIAQAICTKRPDLWKHHIAAATAHSASQRSGLPPAGPIAK
jgi:hypothetical protein